MISDQVKKELIEKYNPDGSPLRNHQIRMLSILDQVSKICDASGIEYWLTHGTLLGAVRHGGFIPWDDDLDICIFRKDLKRFREAMNNYLPDNMVLQCHQNDSNYYHPYYKVRDLDSEVQETGNEDINYKYRGIWIDVFPVEKLHLIVSRITYRIWGKLLYTKILPEPLNLWRLIRNRTLYFAFSIVFMLCRILDRILSAEKWYFPYGCFFDSAPGYTDAEVLPVKKTEKVLFEGKMYKCPNDYDSYLTKCYGNYMELPDEKSIEVHINNVKLF